MSIFRPCKGLGFYSITRKYRRKKFTFFYLKNNKIVGALFVNDPKNVIPVRRFIMQNTIFNDPSILGDTHQKIKEVATKETNN
ncbi:hypothetical protein CV093_05040 [Oceanobacillus sp. 143]|nr:hypothetical protein CV093_05040 [Oceanobacillus sp. 143]